MGNIYDSTHKKLGKIDDDRHIWNSAGEKIGYSDGKKLFDMDGHLVGWVDPDGKIYDGDARHAGFVESETGAVKDWNGRMVGKSDTPHLELGAAALLLFFME